MPAKNVLKTYEEGGFYHIYNRGVAGQKIFLVKQDYEVFLRFLKEYLLPEGHVDLKQLRKINPDRRPINCSDDTLLLAYCLMPNHFHLLIKNLTERGMERLMRALTLNYGMYFNKRYNRVGHVFQGTYRAVKIESDEQLLYVSKYIHSNPKELLLGGEKLEKYTYSSYKNYLGFVNQDWVKPQEILLYFSESKDNSSSYKGFVEETALDADIISGVALDAE